MDLQANDIRGKPPDGVYRQSNAPPEEKSGNRGIEPAEPVPGELQNISDWLSKVRFRRQWIGGLDERSVWNKIRELNAMYEEALRAERIRYDVLLEEYRKTYQSGVPDSFGDSGTGTSNRPGHIQPEESG